MAGFSLHKPTGVTGKGKVSWINNGGKQFSRVNLGHIYFTLTMAMGNRCLPVW